MTYQLINERYGNERVEVTIDELRETLRDVWGDTETELVERTDGIYEVGGELVAEAVSTTAKPTAILLPELQGFEHPGARMFKARIHNGAIQAYDMDNREWFTLGESEIAAGLLLDDHGARLVELAIKTGAADELEQALERLRVEE